MPPDRQRGWVDPASVPDGDSAPTGHHHDVDSEPDWWPLGQLDAEILKLCARLGREEDSLARLVVEHRYRIERDRLAQESTSQRAWFRERALVSLAALSIVGTTMAMLLSGDPFVAAGIGGAGGLTQSVLIRKLFVHWDTTSTTADHTTGRRDSRRGDGRAA